MTDRYKLFIVAPTCFYYQVAIFRELAVNPGIDLTVYFCSDESLSSADLAKEFKTESRWGVEQELLRGFNYKFMKNYSPVPSYLRSIYGLMNFGVLAEIRNHRPDAVIIMSWMNPTWWLTILACTKYKIPFFYMTDANFRDEEFKPRWSQFLKRLLLGRIIFPLTRAFLCAGQANRQLYRYYGVPERKLHSYTYSWGYQPLLEAKARLKPKSELREGLGIPVDKYVFLYAGRLSGEKDLLNLLEAYGSLDPGRTSLVFVGDGPMKSSLEKYAAQNSIESIIFCGFQNRNAIPNFYAAADAVVLPSEQETWGMVVNEAMCFELPIIVSDIVGSGIDLVEDGENGYVFPRKNVEALASCMKRLSELPKEDLNRMGAKSLEKIKQWLDRDLGKTLVSVLDQQNGTRESTDPL